jgi:predicted  nucleic acid-binding Zn-ribbon protein
MDNKIADDLLKMKKKIDDSKIEVAQIEGSQKELMKSLKEQFGCNSIEEAEKKLEELEKETDTLEKEIDSEYKQLEKELKAIEESV